VVYDNPACSVVVNTAGSALTRIRRRSVEDFCSVATDIGPRSDVIFFALKTYQFDGFSTVHHGIE
jgi:hypothetical protein